MRPFRTCSLPFELVKAVEVEPPGQLVAEASRRSDGSGGAALMISCRTPDQPGSCGMSAGGHGADQRGPVLDPVARRGGADSVDDDRVLGAGRQAARHLPLLSEHLRTSAAGRDLGL